MPLYARDIMSKNPITVRNDTPLIDAAKILLEKRFNGMPVLDEADELVGIICQSDFISQEKSLRLPAFFFLLDGFIPLQSPRNLEEDMQRMSAATVGELMTPTPYTIDPDTPLDAIATLMVEQKYHSLPVVSEGKLIGIVGKEDILRSMVANASSNS